ncbi:methyltransferase family protein [Congregibacter litoralis]|uniref:Isoprenylcysteine carboxylmethyltransferase family protein n=1 Tax=Congregibacter litoralis KT71 TaxID=314285 RepID=A4AA40_9GAMM|nr:isoprenylcysteine carboxylmethyltransferase family protein [Congregibacter litoralis]EAQ97357.1 putative protein-S-isoprenylcysteine methyltransferase [Congregibacter litoralis KT71]
MNLELKIPPVILLAGAGALMWLVDRGDSFAAFTLPMRHGLSALALTFGIVIALLGVKAFRQAGTTVDPRYPERSSELVVIGVYKITRNPMYLGMLLVLIAWGLYLGSGLSLLVALGFLTYMTRFQIVPEERFMAQRFGDDFVKYRRSVRRWL